MLSRAVSSPRDSAVDPLARLLLSPNSRKFRQAAGARLRSTAVPSALGRQMGGYRVARTRQTRCGHDVCRSPVLQCDVVYARAHLVPPRRRAVYAASAHSQGQRPVPQLPARVTTHSFPGLKMKPVGRSSAAACGLTPIRAMDLRRCRTDGRVAPCTHCCVRLVFSRALIPHSRPAAMLHSRAACSNTAGGACAQRRGFPLWVPRYRTVSATTHKSPTPPSPRRAGRPRDLAWHDVTCR